MKAAATLGLIVALCGGSQSFGKEKCETDIDKALAIGFIKAMNSDGGQINVVVDEIVFAGMQFNSKLGFAKAFECAIAGPGKALSEFNVLSDLTNKRLATWSWGKLTIE
ncbi:hypothetical protein P6U16_08515 [Rhizobium sp. 32-5/1]|uniref:hypothetical protein n=1 Tax=Rhizobium sp. 32-5/1 TaxID=3019602 RepID=UPI00240CEDFA|nr:hypothetical protein [Rhizobium sp. 32-5/1]WEZ84601.1 hypothetical protein P6U16_08515 [Rhizobium sp. 32-5/1]